jgi:hypothetical protein
MVAELDNSLLKVMYTYYFDAHSFESVFFHMAEDIFNAHKDSLAGLSKAFQA